ncbi:hypothetical protein C8R45DRAFT_936958 [Mycena sanguinolenta]|nr:hypothetical protein C8R45DRAFT_936958 [Mycena sanguinolenta]
MSALELPFGRLAQAGRFDAERYSNPIDRENRRIIAHTDISQDTDLVEARISGAHAGWESNGAWRGRADAADAVLLPVAERMMHGSSGTREESARTHGRAASTQL